MAVITFQNPKGGSSKSTSALILATTLAKNGQRIAVIDSDQNAPLMRWAEGRRDDNLTVVSAYLEDVMRQAAKLHVDHDYVIIDTEGTAHSTVGYALSRTDLAIMPFAQSILDVEQAGKAIGFLETQAEKLNRPIPYRLLFTRTNAAFQTRVEKQIRRDANEDQVRFFETTLGTRAAYIEMFVKRQTIWEMSEKEVSGLPMAIENATAFAKEVAGICQKISTSAGRVAA